MSYQIPDLRGTKYEVDPEILKRFRLPPNAFQLFSTKVYKKQEVKKQIQIDGENTAKPCWSGEEFSSSSNIIKFANVYIPAVTNGFAHRDREGNANDIFNVIESLNSRRGQQKTLDMMDRVEWEIWQQSQTTHKGSVIHGVVSWPSDTAANLRTALAGSAPDVAMRKMINVPTTSLALEPYWTNPDHAVQDFKNKLMAYSRLQIPVFGEMRHYITTGMFLAMFGNDDNGRNTWDALSKMTESIKGVNQTWYIIPRLLAEGVDEASDNGVWLTELVDVARSHIVKFKQAGPEAHSIRDDINYQDIHRMRTWQAFGVHNTFGWTKTFNIYKEEAA